MVEHLPRIPQAQVLSPSLREFTVFLNSKSTFSSALAPFREAPGWLAVALLDS